MQGRETTYMTTPPSFRPGDVYEAVRDDNKTRLEELLKQGADPNDKDTHGTPALVCAVKKGYIGHVHFLLDHGANIHEKDGEGHNALMWAASDGYNLIVKILIDKGANLEEADKDGDTPAVIAQKANHPEIADVINATLQRRTEEQMKMAENTRHESVIERQKLLKSRATARLQF